MILRHMRLEIAALIYRAMNGDKEAETKVMVGEVDGLCNAASFEEFLDINRISIYEEVVRDAV